MANIQSSNSWQGSHTVEGIALPREERKNVGSQESNKDTLFQPQIPSDDWWTGSWYKGRDYSLVGNEAAVTNSTRRPKTDYIDIMHRRD